MILKAEARKVCYIGLATLLTVLLFRTFMFDVKKIKLSEVHTSVEVPLTKKAVLSGKDVIKSNQTRIVCWINTYRANLDTKAKAVRETWGRRCDKLLFFSDKNNASFPTIGFNTTEGRMRMVSRIFKAFDYVYQHHYDDADWFMRSDDDTYVIMENLRYLLTSYSPTDKWYLGRAYNFGTKQGFNSGGAAFVLSKASLKTLYKRPRNKCRNAHQRRGHDDFALGRCLYSLGVRIGDTRDSLNRSRFHPYRPVQHLNGYLCNIKGKSNLRYNCTKGIEWISEYAISFHHLTPEELYMFEMLLYHIRPHGVQKTALHINKDDDINADKKVRKEEFKVYFKK